MKLRRQRAERRLPLFLVSGLYRGDSKTDLHLRARVAGVGRAPVNGSDQSRQTKEVNHGSAPAPDPSNCYDPQTRHRNRSRARGGAARSTGGGCRDEPRSGRGQHPGLADRAARRPRLAAVDRGRGALPAVGGRPGPDRAGEDALRAALRGYALAALAPVLVSVLQHIVGRETAPENPRRAAADSRSPRRRWRLHRPLRRRPRARPRTPRPRRPRRPRSPVAQPKARDDGRRWRHPGRPAAAEPSAARQRQERRRWQGEPSRVL